MKRLRDFKRDLDERRDLTGGLFAGPIDPIDIGAQQQAALERRREAAIAEEHDRQERVKALAPKAKRARRELQTAKKRLADTTATAEEGERGRQAAYDEHLRLANAVSQLEWGSDADF